MSSIVRLTRSSNVLTLAALAQVGGFVPAQCGSTITIPAINTTWTLQGSPYCVTQTITVGNLTIDPGVEVRLAPGVSLNVVSWVRAVGTKQQPIVFRAQNLASGRWGGLQFDGPVAPGNTSLLQHCVITEANNSGIRIVNNDQVALVGCLVHDNTSPQDGGGLSILLASGTLALFDCEIRDNTAARHGGGIAASGAAGALLALTDCRVHGNVANPANAPGSFQGGGIRASGNLALLGCSVAGNSVTTQTCGGSIAARGGGLHCGNGDVFLARTLIMDNLCSTFTVPSTCGGQSGIAEGGGVFADSTVGVLRIENSILSSNTAGAGGQASTRRGSGLQTAAASTLISNCTIARNADEGIRVVSGATSVSNSIVYFHPVANITGQAMATHSDIQNGYPGVGNLNFDPAFVGPGSHPEHYALAPFSPCIDAGDPGASSNDACRPSGRGTERNDMGALGGPGNCGSSGPSVVVCGAQSYGGLLNAMTLDWSFTSGQAPFPGVMSIGNGFAQSAALLLVGFEAGATPLNGLTILVDPASANPVPFVLDGSGSWSATINLQVPFLVGVPVLFQALSLPASGLARASNGLRLAPCP